MPIPGIYALSLLSKVEWIYAIYNSLCGANDMGFGEKWIMPGKKNLHFSSNVQPITYMIYWVVLRKIELRF